MLRHLNMDQHATRIWKAVCKVTAEGKTLTRDLKGNATTEEFASAVIDKME